MRRQGDRCAFCRAALSEMVGFVTAPALRFCLAPGCMRRGFARAKVDVSELAAAAAPSVLTRPGDWFRRARNAAGLSQSYVAEQAGCTQTMVSQLERLGRAPEHVIDAVAAVLELAAPVQPESSAAHRRNGHAAAGARA